MTEINRYEIIQKLISKQMTEEEARKMIGLKSVRQIRRIKKRVLEEGVQGIAHKSQGRASPRKMTDEQKAEVIGLVKENYHDFKPTFANEKLRENHRIYIGTETLRQLMIANKLWKTKSRKKQKVRHVWRARKDNYGEMQQFDGSYHKWFEDREKECCLLAAIDDATGDVTHMEFALNEGVLAVFKFWKFYIEEKGVPLSVYLDKYSTYKINHVSAVDNKDLMTQFQRAAQQVGMSLINAHSAEAKGRVERLFHTLQDRLIKEMRLRGISNMEEGNKFLREEYIAKFNAQFSVVPKEKTNVHKKFTSELKEQLPQIFSVQNERKVQNDYTIMFKNQFFQLDEIQPTTVYKKDTVIIEEHLDGQTKISLNGKYLNFHKLPQKPRKQNIPVVALTRQETDWDNIPKKHPWKIQREKDKIANNNEPTNDNDNNTKKKKIFHFLNTLTNTILPSTMLKNK